MKKIIFAGVLVWMVMTGCKKDKLCTTEFKTISVTITNLDGSPATFEKLNLIRLGTHDTIAITNDGGATYPLVDDNFDLTGTEDFLLEGFKNGQLLLSEAYVFGRDECHIQKVSGKNTIVLD